MMKLGQLGKLMKDASALQEKMQEMQQVLEDMEIEGTAGGGVVKVVADGKGRVKRCAVDDSMMDAAEKGVLEDLIVAACNDAKAKAEAKAAEETQKLIGGMGLPPGFLPDA